MAELVYDFFLLQLVTAIKIAVPDSATWSMPNIKLIVMRKQSQIWGRITVQKTGKSRVPVCCQGLPEQLKWA